REEEDGGQDLEGEDEAEGLLVGHDGAEHELRALAGEGEQLLDAVVGEGEEMIHRRAQHEHGDGDEDCHPHRHRTQPAVGTQPGGKDGKGESGHPRGAEAAHQTVEHGWSPARIMRPLPRRHGTRSRYNPPDSTARAKGPPWHTGSSDSPSVDWTAAPRSR